jgi:hypothetical protein
MMTTLIGVLATEIFPISSKTKQVITLLGLVTLLASTNMLFGLFSYFRFGLFVFLVLFSFVILRLMAKNAKSAAIPTLMMLWGLMQLEGGAPTDLTAVANSMLYYYEFALCGVITVLIFPNFKTNSFMSAFLRILETDISNIGKPGFKNSNSVVLTAFSVLEAKTPLCPPTYFNLYQAIIVFQNQFLKKRSASHEDILLSKSILSELTLAINLNQQYPIEHFNLQRIRQTNPTIYEPMFQLIKGYNQCLA